MSPRSTKRALAGALAATLGVSGPLAFAQSSDAPMQVSVTRTGDAATATQLILPFGKSAIVDLPTDARDVLLSSPDIADIVVRTSRRLYVIGRKLGQTNAFVFDANGRQVANIEIRVEPDVGPLNDLFRRFAPNAAARAEAVNGSLVLSGKVRNAAESERVLRIAERFITSPGSNSGGGAIVNLLEVEGTEQVMVRVRIVEMSRTLVRQLGVNAAASSNIVNTLVPEDTFVRLATANGYSVSGGALGGLTAEVGTVDFDGTGRVTEQLDAAIEAFERVGLLRVLAEPNLTAVSGESARFLAGGEFPVPAAADEGNITVSFKPFGVGLAFTPIVLSEGNISLKLSTEVSELTSEGAISTGDGVVTDDNGQTTIVRGITIPALQVRRAETTVEVSSGGAIVLAGLIQERTRQAIEGLPGAMDTPVLGALFRSRDFVNNQTELVIIVTPYLVTQTDPDNLRTPLDGFEPPRPGEAFLTSRLNAIYRTPNANSEAGGTLQGAYGHVIP